MTPTEIIGQIDSHLSQAATLSRQLRTALAAGAPPPPLPPLARPLVGSRWTERTARAAVGILVRHARAGTLLTYTDLHREVAAAGGPDDVGALQKYKAPLDKICEAFKDAYQRTRVLVPLLTVVVVNARTRLPGGGTNQHLRLWLDESGITHSGLDASSSDPMPKPLFDIALKAVHDYKGWDEAVASLGLTGDPARDMQLM
jgi:hypothetical protein